MLILWLCLPVLYPASEGPVAGLTLRRRIPLSASRLYAKPVIFAEPWLPEAVNEVRARWIAWWLPPIGESD